MARFREDRPWAFGAGQQVVGDGEAGHASTEESLNLRPNRLHGHLCAALGEDSDDRSADSAELTSTVRPASARVSL
jgi:hypothetical protein